MTRNERLYRATGDPLYVLSAIIDYEECPNGKPWPSWVTDYLREISSALVLMADQGQPAKSAKRVATTLGLTSRGRNRFKEYQMDRRAEAAVWAHDQARGLFREGDKEPTAAAIDEWLAQCVRPRVSTGTARNSLQRGRGLNK